MKKEGLGDPYERRLRPRRKPRGFGPGFKESLPNQAHGSGPQPIYEGQWGSRDVPRLFVKAGRGEATVGLAQTLGLPMALMESTTPGSSLKLEAWTHVLLLVMMR